MVDLEIDEHQSKSAGNENGTEHSSVAQGGRKRKITDDDGDDNSSNGRNETFVVKRGRTNDDIATVAVAGAATNDDDFDQSQDNFNEYITDDNSTEQSERATQQNGKRSIDSDEAFKQGYVVVIPSTCPSFPISIHFLIFYFVYDFCSENG